MIEITKEAEAEKAWLYLEKARRARGFLRLSLNAFVQVALIDQREHGASSTEFGMWMASMYREFRIKNKFWEVV